MLFENYEGTALDSDVFEEQTNEEPTEMDNSVDETIATEEDNSEGNSTDTADTPASYNIEGVGTFTADEIREMRNGNLRQSDYTRKTQELARQREELKNAEVLFNYLNANPHIVEAMKQAEANPNGVATTHAPTVENKLLKQIAHNQIAMETDFAISKLKDKYSNVDEVALLQKATELGTSDLEFVYKALNYDNHMDERAIIEKAKEELRQELEANKNVVSTTVSNRKGNVSKTTPSLTSREQRIAEAFDMSASDWEKWK